MIDFKKEDILEYIKDKHSLKKEVVVECQDKEVEEAVRIISLFEQGGFYSGKFCFRITIESDGEVEIGSCPKSYYTTRNYTIISFQRFKSELEDHLMVVEVI